MIEPQSAGWCLSRSADAASREDGAGRDGDHVARGNDFYSQGETAQGR